MKISKNSYSRFEFNGIKDQFVQKGNTVAGVKGYSKCIGWILSLFGFSICLKDDQNRTFYLNRKSAIHWINRHQKAQLNENSTANEVVARIKALIQPVEHPQVQPISLAEQSIVQLEKLEKMKSLRDGAIWFENMQDLTAYRNLVKRLFNEGFFKQEAVRDLPNELRSRLFDQLSSDTFRYIYEGIKFPSQEAFISLQCELFFNLDPTHEQLARFTTYLPSTFFKIAKIEWFQKIKASLSEVDFEKLKPLFKQGAARLFTEIPKDRQELLLNILVEHVLHFVQENEQYAPFVSLVQKLQEIEPAFTFEYLVLISNKTLWIGHNRDDSLKALMPFSLIAQALHIAGKPEDETLLQKYHVWEAKYRSYKQSYQVFPDDINEEIYLDHYDYRTPFVPGAFALKKQIKSLDIKYDSLLLTVFTAVEKEEEAKFLYYLLKEKNTDLLMKFEKAMRQRQINTLLW